MQTMLRLILNSLLNFIEQKKKILILSKYITNYTVIFIRSDKKKLKSINK